MENLALEKIKEILIKNDKIDIVVCKNPNIDQMGAALGLYLSLIQLGKTASIICPTEPIVEVSNLVGIDKVRTGLKNEGGDVVVSFPYKEGEIEKISYTLEDNFLNIIVKVGEKGLSFGENDILFRRSGGTSKVIFVIGAAKLSDLGSVSEIEKLKDTVIINIDNKADNQGFGDIVLVSKNLSVSEDVANIIFGLNLKTDIDTSQNLMSGICSATDNFQNPKTSALAFEMAGFLMKNGAARPGKSVREQELKEQDLNEEKPILQHFFSEDKKKPRSADKSSSVNNLSLNNPPEDWLAPKIYKGSTNV